MSAVSEKWKRIEMFSRSQGYVLTVASNRFIDVGIHPNKYFVFEKTFFPACYQAQTEGNLSENQFSLNRASAEIN